MLDSDGISRHPNRWGFNSFTEREGPVRSLMAICPRPGGVWHIWRLKDGTYDYTASPKPAEWVQGFVTAGTIGELGEQLRDPGQRRLGPWRGGRSGPAPRPIQHGTGAGYQAHRGRGEEPCEACRVAKAEYSAAYYLDVTKPRRHKRLASR